MVVKVWLFIWMAQFTPGADTETSVTVIPNSTNKAARVLCAQTKLVEDHNHKSDFKYDSKCQLVTLFSFKGKD